MSATRPPVFARWLAWLLVPEREREFVLGDLEEGFHDRPAASPRRHARRWYWRETLNLVTTRWPRVTYHVPHAPGASPMSSLWNEVRIAD